MCHSLVVWMPPAKHRLSPVGWVGRHRPMWWPAMGQLLSPGVCMEAEGNRGRREVAGILGFPKRDGECCGKTPVQGNLHGTWRVPNHREGQQLCWLCVMHSQPRSVRRMPFHEHFWPETEVNRSPCSAACPVTTVRSHWRQSCLLTPLPSSAPCQPGTKQGPSKCHLLCLVLPATALMPL